MAKHSLNEQTGQLQYDQTSKRITFTNESDVKGLSEQVRDNPIQHARALLASSVCDNFTTSSGYRVGIGI